MSIKTALKAIEPKRRSGIAKSSPGASAAKLGKAHHGQDNAYLKISYIAQKWASCNACANRVKMQNGGRVINSELPLVCDLRDIYGLKSTVSSRGLRELLKTNKF